MDILSKKGKNKDDYKRSEVKMKMEFFCGGVIEYTGTYRQIQGIEGVNIEEFDLKNRRLCVDGISSKNQNDVLIRLQELGWRKLT